MDFKESFDMKNCVLTVQYNIIVVESDRSILYLNIIIHCAELFIIIVFFLPKDVDVSKRYPTE